MNVTSKVVGTIDTTGNQNGTGNNGGGRNVITRDK
jgi:hypothetical protein